MNDPEHSEAYTTLAQNSPKLLLKGNTPRLIDEWQDAPELWDSARFEVDHRERKTGQFIFTGSTVIPKEKLEKIKHTGTGLVASIYTDLKNNAERTMTEDTISSYISALKKLFVIEDAPAWNPNLRSKTAIRTSDTRYFVDSSIATAALGIGPEKLLSDLNTMGLLFETMCIRDLRIYSEALDGKIYHFRDKNGLECDAVIHLRDGRYGLVEIKLGGLKLIDEGAKTLNKLSKKINTEKMMSPSFMMVLTGTGAYAYKRKDGVWVVPIGCLKP